MESVVRSRYGALTASRSRMNFNVNALSRTGGALFDAAGGDSDLQQDDFERLGHLNKLVNRGDLTRKKANEIYVNK